MHALEYLRLDSDRTPLYQGLYGVLLDGIERGLLPPGAVLTESRLARHFGVSRAPVRQALGLLRLKGAISDRPGRSGFAVSSPRGASAESGHPDLEVLRPLEKTHLLRDNWKWTRVYDRIKADLLLAATKGDHRIVPSRMADHYGITRTVLRDAQLRLISDGILRLEGQDWRLNQLNERIIRDQYSVRKLLEPWALAESFSMIDRAMAYDCLEDLQRADADRSAVTADWLEKLETDLHVGLLEPCGNEHLMVILRHSRLVHVFNSYFFQEYRPRHAFLREHIEVFHQVVNGNLDGAKAALVFHLESSTADTVQRLEQFSELEPLGEIAYLRPA